MSIRMLSSSSGAYMNTTSSSGSGVCIGTPSSSGSSLGDPAVGPSYSASSYNSAFSIQDMAECEVTVHTGLYSMLAWKEMMCASNGCDQINFNPMRRIVANLYLEIDNEICFKAVMPKCTFNGYVDSSNLEDSNESVEDMLRKKLGAYYIQIVPLSKVCQCIAGILVHGKATAEKIYGKRMVGKVIGRPLNQMEIELKDTVRDELDKLAEKHEKMKDELSYQKESEMLALRGKIIKKYENKRMWLLKKIAAEKRKMKRDLLKTVGKRSAAAKELIDHLIHTKSDKDVLLNKPTYGVDAGLQQMT